LQSRGVRLIDVGCFQVDLRYHPTAFSNLEQAFDPDANANYAAHFLTELRVRTGSWSAAVASYHSGQALEGESYRRKVLAQWGSDAAFDGAPTLPADAGANRRATTPDRFVVLMSAAARAIPVIGP
jgi:soluble lytic murein transglycosylase-like protein